MKRRNITLVLLIVILIVLAYFASNEIKKATYAVRVYVLRSKVILINSGTHIVSIDELGLNEIPLFLNMSHQRSMLLNLTVNGKRAEYYIARDADGNPGALIKATVLVLPGSNVTISYEIEIQEYYPKGYPSKGPNPSKYLDDMGPWQVNNSELVGLAEKLNSSAKSDYDYILNAILWVKSHIFYRGRIPPRYPIEVFRDHAGDCDEQALLLGTLCRIVGIPAFLQVGAVYIPGEVMRTAACRGRWISETYNIGWHAWCMVYIKSKGWIPVDLTAYSRSMPLPYATINGAPLLSQGTLVVGNISTVDYIKEIKKFVNMLYSYNLTFVTSDSLSLVSEGMIIKPTRPLLLSLLAIMAIVLIIYLYLREERRAYMNIFEAIKTRRSIRRFKEVEIPEEDLKKILEAAIWAPSAGNLQPWEFIVVKDKKIKERLAEAALGQMWMTTAPVIVVVCANLERSASRYGERGRNLYAIQDTAAAIENMLLAAHALGYGACWVGAFDEEEVRRILNIPHGIRPVALIPMGRPAEEPSVPYRRSLKDIVHKDVFGRPYF